mgnify:CR=1 FL=1
MSAPSSIVFGAGSWGTALAVHLAHAGHRVQLWGRDVALVSAMRDTRVNDTYLPGIELPALLEPVATIDGAAAARFAVFAVPSHGLRAVARSVSGVLPPDAILISATKGLEEGSLDRMSQVLCEELPGHPVVVLSGPSFALELARKQPTAVVAASGDADAVAAVQEDRLGVATRAAAERGQTILFAAGNGVGNAFDVPVSTYGSDQTGPDWKSAVGAIRQSTSLADSPGASVSILAIF